MASILITGGAGFIGSHTTELLLRGGHHVTVVDAFSSGSRANLPDAPHALVTVQADVRDASALGAVLAGRRFDAVIHLAARASVMESIADPIGSHAVNVTGTLNVLEAARRAGVGRVVVASSAAVYGNAPVQPCQEEALPAPCSPYAAHKAECELLCAAYRASYGLEAVVLRYFNVYGPRQPAGSPYSGVIAVAAARLCAGKTVMVYGDGEQTRDFIYVSDVAAANLRAALGRYPGAEPINVATGRATSVLDVVSMMRRLLRVDATLSFAPPRPGDVRDSCASVERLRARLGCEAVIPLETGLGRLLNPAPSTSDRLHRRAD